MKPPKLTMGCGNLPHRRLAHGGGWGLGTIPEPWYADAAENTALTFLLCPVIVLVAQLGVLRYSTRAAERSKGESQRRRRLRFGLLLHRRR